MLAPNMSKYFLMLRIVTEVSEKKKWTFVYLLLTGTWIEAAAHAVPHKVQRKHRQREDQTWPQQQGGVAIHLRPRRVDHAPPARVGRLHANPEE